MKTLTEILQEIVCQQAESLRLRPDECLGPVYISLWQSAEPPPVIVDWIAEVARKSCQALRKQDQRAKAKSSQQSERITVPSKRSAEHEVLDAELMSRIRDLPEDDFERDALLVMLGEHSEIRSERELVLSNGRKSERQSYRRLRRFKKRVLQMVSPKVCHHASN